MYDIGDSDEGEDSPLDIVTQDLHKAHGMDVFWILQRCFVWEGSYWK